jgi:recombination protein RecT
MSTASIASKAPNTAARAAAPVPQQDQFATVRALLERSKEQIMRALPKHLTADRLMRVSLTELSSNPELLACDQISFVGAVIKAAQLGLEPGSGQGLCHFVPFWNNKKGVKEVILIPGFRGLIKLAMNGGKIKKVVARAVYERDDFDYAFGTEEYIKHKPYEGDDDPGEIVKVYAIAWYMDGTTQFDVMSVAQVNKVRDQSAGGKNPVWKTWYDEMAKKTMIRRLCKQLPTSIELEAVLQTSDKEARGESQNNSQILIDVGVKPIESQTATTPQAIDAEATAGVAASKDDENRRAMLDKVEELISRRMKGGQEPSDIEQLIGMPLDDVNDLPTERLLLIWEKLKT